MLQIETLRLQNKMLKEERNGVVNELRVCKEKFESLKQVFEEFWQEYKYCYDTISKDEPQFKKATGLELKPFNSLYDFLNPGEDCCNIKFHETVKERVKEIANVIEMDIDFIDETPTCPKRGPKPKLHPKDQLFMVYHG